MKASFIDALEYLGYEKDTYPMQENDSGIVITLQIGHSKQADIVIEDDEFTLTLNGNVALSTTDMDRVVEHLDCYIADFGY